ncbi:MAG: HlyD family efflux transporter periplasmic adaptor subunit [Phycisphaeraceae bacterium]
MTSTATSMITPTPAPPRRLPRLIAVGIAGVAAFALMAWLITWFMGGNAGAAVDAQTSGTAPQWYTVTLRSFDQIVSASGELDAKNQVEIKSKVEGSTPIVELVDEGTYVQGPTLDDKGEVVSPGQILAKLADDQLLSRIESAQVAVEAAMADKVAADQYLAIQINQAENDQRAAEVKLNLAELNLAKWQSGDDPQKQRELALALEKAQRTLKTSGENVIQSRQLHKEQFISDAELEDDEIKVLQAENDLESAKLAIQVYKNYTRPAEEQKAKSDVDQANSELQRTVSKSKSDLARLEADVKSKTQTLKIRQEGLEKLQTQLRATVIHAPRSGMVVYASSLSNRRWRGDPIAQGREIRFNESLFVLPDTRQMNAALKVHEAVVAQVKAGQEATVMIDARPGEVIKGKVTNIAVTPEDGGWMNPDLREYRVTVELPEGVDDKLKPAMRCSGKVMVGRVENVLAVPIQAIFTEGPIHFVYVPNGDGRVKPVAVDLGRTSETLVEIKSVLKERDQVLLRKPKPGEAVNLTPDTAKAEQTGGSIPETTGGSQS